MLGFALDMLEGDTGTTVNDETGAVGTSPQAAPICKCRLLLAPSEILASDICVGLELEVNGWGDDCES